MPALPPAPPFAVIVVKPLQVPFEAVVAVPAIPDPALGPDPFVPIDNVIVLAPCPVTLKEVRE